MKIVRESWRIVALLLLLTSAFALPTQGKDLTARMPADTWILLAVDDLAQLRDAWAASPYRDAWKSPELNTVREIAEKTWKDLVKEGTQETGVSPQEVLSLLNGYVAVFSTMNEFRPEGDYSMREWDTCLVAEIAKKDHKEIRRILDLLLKNIPEDAKKRVEEFKGQKVYIIEYYQQKETEDAPGGLEGLQLLEEIPIHIEYVLTDDYFILCEGRNQPLRPVLAGLLGDNGRSIQSVGRYKDLRRHVGNREGFTAYFNPDRLFEQQVRNPEIKSFLDRAQEFGLRKVGPALLTWGIAEEGLFTSAAIAVPEEHRGLLAMLYAGETNPVASAKHVPRNIHSYVSITADLKEIWAGARALARIVNPQVDSVLSAYLLSSVSNFNVDLEADILNNITGEHAYYSRELPPEVKAELTSLGDSAPALQSEVYLLRTANGEKLVQALDQFFNRLTGEPYQIPLEHFTQRGFNIWTMRQMPGQETALRFSIALTPSHLILANSLIEAQEAVRRVTGDTTNSLANDKSFQATLADGKREGLRMFSYTSPEAIASISAELRQVIALGLLEDLELKPEDVPPPQWWERTFGSVRQSARLLPDTILLDSQWYPKR